MRDGIIKNDGTSRLIKGALPSTYDAYKAAVEAGTQGVDVLFNASGWTQRPTFLNKGTLLSDTTASALGLAGDPTVDDALGKLSGAALVQEAGGEPIRTAVGLSSIPIGSVVNLMENNVETKFYVAQHNYEPGLNTNRTLLVRVGSGTSRLWDTANTNAYASSDIDAYLNGPYKAMFSENIKTAMATTRFRYTAGNGASTVTTLDRSIFLLSATELGLTSSYANTEGTALSIADTLRAAMTQWTRTPRKSDTTGVCAVYNGTYIEVYGANQNTLTTVPAFTLHGNTTFYKSGTAYYERQAYTNIYNIATDVLGNTIGGFTRIEAGSYVGTGTYGAGNPNTLTFNFTPQIWGFIGCLYRANSGYNPGYSDLSVLYPWESIDRVNDSNFGIQITVSDNTVSWFNEKSANGQKNAPDTPYYYFAIG